MSAHQQAVSAINSWLIDEGRRSNDPVLIIETYVAMLQNAGLSLDRIRLAQRFKNPLMVAWGGIWTKDGVDIYTVPRSRMDTSAWIGSPFEYVIENNRPLRKILKNLHSDDHETYHELQAEGGTDFYVTVLEYGDGSRQGCSYMTGRDDGFTAAEIDVIDQTRHALASAFEPITMRRSTHSLLETYLGVGPARAVIDGSIQRGEHVKTEAAIMFADLRGFTAKSGSWPEPALLTALDDYFEAVIEAVREQGGDVLKLMGDGVLAMFPVTESKQTCSINAVRAAQAALAKLAHKNQRRAQNGAAPLAAGIGVSFGRVTYGNIGSPDRLDFTIVGEAVNRASRIQDLCKTQERAILFDATIAEHLSEPVDPIGSHPLRGLPGQHAIFSVRASTQEAR